MNGACCWMARRGDGTWVPLRLVDGVRVESCFRVLNSSAASAQKDDGCLLREKYEHVDIDCGRRVVHLSSRTLTTRYWKSDVCEVRRCVWFYDLHGAFLGTLKKVSGKTVRLPFTEEESALIDAYVSGIAASGVERALGPDMLPKLQLPDGERSILLHTERDGMGRTGMWMYQGDRIRREAGVRIYKQTEPQGAPKDDLLDDLSQCRTLVIVVHGIGETMWRKRAQSTSASEQGASIPQRWGNTHIVGSVDQLRRLSDDLVRSGYKAWTKGKSSSIPKGRVEFLPIEWSSAVRSPEKEKQLRAITLPGVSALRSLANDVILDVLFYMNPETRRVIKETVKTQVEQTVALFCENNPDFLAKGGTVSFLGHSLGSVILWDLLSSEENPFSFEAETLTLLGSPVAVFEAVRGAEMDKSFRLRSCKRVYNVFHPHDVVAYRIEPLFSDALTAFPPATVPLADGSEKFHQSLKKAASFVSSTFASLFAGSVARADASSCSSSSSSSTPPKTKSKTPCSTNLI